MSKGEVKLKVAAEEIKEILRKHDIAAAVVLHTPGHGEHFVHLNTSYSCAYMYNEKEVRFYSKQKDYKTVEEHLEKVSNTSNMLKILTDVTGYVFMGVKQMSDFIDKKTEIEHTNLTRK